MMPPFIVEERVTPLKWHYHAAPGFEVLAACDPALAATVVQRQLQLNEMLATILPPRFLAAPPETLILVDEDIGQSQAREVLADAMKRREAGQNQAREVLAEAVKRGDVGAARATEALQGIEVNFIPNLRLVDSDMSAVFAVVSPFVSQQFFYAPERIEALLEQRVPRLPDWFIEGAAGFYRQIVKFSESGNRTPGLGTTPWIQVGEATWISKQESAALRNDPNRAHRLLMPMAEFFAHRRDRSAVVSRQEAAWRAQAAFFVRWAIMENDGANRAALWTLVDRLEREPASEALFQECFGRGYASVRNDLIDFLPTAVRAVNEGRWIQAPPTAGQSPARPKLRPATDLEVARLRGDWERLEIGYVRQNSPAVVDEYVAQARKTIARAYKQGERDPRLLAAMGLTELDAGNPGEAQGLLAEAATGRVVRPRVYFELARLRYAAIARGIGPQAKLTAAQAAEVLGPLSEGLRQNPPLLETYALFTEVLSRSDAPPTAAQLAALHEGARKFPEASELVARAIYFHLASNQPAAAAALAEAGLRAARDPEMRRKFERARDNLSETMAPAKE